MFPNEKSQAVRLGSAVSTDCSIDTSIIPQRVVENSQYAVFLTPPDTHQAVLACGMRPTNNSVRQPQNKKLSNFVKK
jgi:hypothetical protein